jgi:SAM-dependent methyltransferase
MTGSKANWEPLWRAFAHRRLARGNLNEALDIPAVLSLVPEASSGKALDLGCGIGESSFRLAEHKRYSVLAVDSEPFLIGKAKELYPGDKIVWLQQRFEHLTFEAEAFDVIVSCLAFHFVDDLHSLIRNCWRWLKEGGLLVFSVRHPLRTALPTGEHEVEGDEVGWLIKDYLVEGRRNFDWLGYSCENHHRPISTYFSLLRDAGFSVEVLLEPAMPGGSDLARESRSVPFLFVVSARK